MIVITKLYENSFCVSPGDTFNLTITDNLNCKVLITEEIIEEKIINFVATFRFALDDGDCAGFHLAGIFANKDELPKEIQQAIMFEDLSISQQRKFASSVGIKL